MGRSDANPSAPWVPREEFLRSEALIKDIMVCFANYSQSEVKYYFALLCVCCFVLSHNFYFINASIGYEKCFMMEIFFQLPIFFHLNLDKV